MHFNSCPTLQTVSFVFRLGFRVFSLVCYGVGVLRRQSPGVFQPRCFRTTWSNGPACSGVRAPCFQSLLFSGRDAGFSTTPARRGKKAKKYSAHKILAIFPGASLPFYAVWSCIAPGRLPGHTAAFPAIIGIPPALCHIRTISHFSVANYIFEFSTYFTNGFPFGTVGMHILFLNMYYFSPRLIISDSKRHSTFITKKSHFSHKFFAFSRQ